MHPGIWGVCSFSSLFYNGYAWNNLLRKTATKGYFNVDEKLNFNEAENYKKNKYLSRCRYTPDPSPTHPHPYPTPTLVKSRFSLHFGIQLLDPEL